MKQEHVARMETLQMHTYYLKNLLETDHLEYLDVDGRIEMYHKEIRLDGVRWIHLAWDWDQWWVLMNTLAGLRVP
jgi:hypothetical protein